VPPTPDAAATRPATKQALVIGMLQRQQGASITELAEATGWLPHTTRAALTGLRKKGHVIAAEKQEGVSRYRLQACGRRSYASNGSG
jgi:DNA-binding MarR family transcriptional regulator